MLQLQADFTDAQCVERVTFGDPEASKELARRLEHFGFVVIELPGPDAPEAKLLILADALGLGEPYIPVLYRREETKDYFASFSDIRNDPGDAHPGFSTTAAQDWHVDGLLDEIGTIKTTLLYCVRPAEQGGETLLFNSVAAFAQLQRDDPAAAEVLLSPDVLTRHSTIPGVEQSATGPVFRIEDDGSYLTRYTDNDTCQWNHSAGANGALNRALQALRTAAADSTYSRGVRLDAGQALVFRNDRLSHGRRAYRDDPTARRHLIRALYG